MLEGEEAGNSRRVTADSEASGRLKGEVPEAWNSSSTRASKLAEG